ncbi:class II fumarate hydratase [Candidatus Methylospira mobilis]|uniref:Fumarate hydratase class II n=1 Tax=Candidatus Methylospira mobilis TaxID=1808979 RepID=A0A5Q0BHC5_9GAMM|nr:class II fumarate hydratase [Candidatus Methylospira mobilis]QFY42532.1 class II fumarate hydratase [Candidatus Methylospira mobilis]WNV04361.1 class II fumarate hydratase [Candidatus Methylospira mobilis]
MSDDYRIEKDSMGGLKVPADALYAAQTQRAVENFPVSGIPLPADFIHAVALIKRCAAQVNQDLGLLEPGLAAAIAVAADEILAGKHAGQFPLDVFQTGSGTSTNMNVNEVIATLASRAGGLPVSANDHVNMGQSSNDTIPSAIHVSAAIAAHRQLIPALQHLHSVLQARAAALRSVVKTGRTHLMDAMPVSLGQEIDGWATQIANAIERLQASLPRIYRLAQGGTAVGTGINADPRFAAQIARKLAEATGIPFEPNSSFFESLSAQDAAVELSGQCRTLAVGLMKIANDLRWMNSGPLAGLGEIELAALQPGSSIMPGKVNPVIPEAVCMVAAQVMGNDATIAIAGQSGNFQLNVMLPLIAYNLLQSLSLLANATRLLADKGIADFKVCGDKIDQALALNPILVTALNPIIGYAKAAEIAKAAYKTRRPVIDVAVELTDIPRDELKRLMDPVKLTGGGIQRV